MPNTTPEAIKPPPPLPFRIFLASPGDCGFERRLAREVIEQLRGERRFRGRFDIQVVAWDQPGSGVALEAGLTPQEAIARGLPKPAECGLVVVLLWSRIGTPLPPDYRKPDGTPYLSGTEWEYRNAREGGATVWLYHRTEVPSIPLDDPEEKEKREQWSKLQGFLADFTNPDGSSSGGLNPYAAPDDFRRQFEQHLRDRLDLLLEQHSPAVGGAVSAPLPPAPEPPLWTDVPYPGLEVFTPKQAPIFFGRGPEVDQLIAGLGDARVRFLAVVGVSGSGKSSLVAAGLIPRLRDGVVGGVPWRDLRFKPGERGGYPFLAMAYALKEKLGTTGETERDLADALGAGTERFSRALERLLDGYPAGSELLLVVDQFEELFTQCADAERGRFLDWFHAVSVLAGLRIVATLRADFYARAVQEPVLASLLRRGRGSFPLDPPGPAALQEMIAGPARAAGLMLEEGLVQQVLEDAGNNPGALALVAFTLHELYLKGGSAGRLTRSDYRGIGGVAGAVRRRAEAVLGRLGAEAEQGLDSLFTHLVEVNEQEVATRRRASKSRLEQGDGRLVAALTDAHLLVTGKGEGDAPTVEVAHEALLNAWPRLERWIEEHADSLRARRDLERAAAEWDTAVRPGSALRTGALLKRYRSSAEPRSGTARDYLVACGRRVLWQKAGMTVMALLVIAAMGFFWHLSKSYYPPALAAQGLLVELGVWPVTEPAMVVVPAGEFAMGDLAGDGRDSEKPVHQVRFAAPFELGAHEVTFEEYDLFAAATGRRKPNDEGWGRGRWPVINVDWQDAVAYVIWISRRTGQTYRLPSEAEWEYAARAGTVWKRYWDETSGKETDPACDYANVFDRGNMFRIKTRYGGINWEPSPCDDPFPFTALVGEFAPNAWGLHDMLGNVWEWTQDCWHDSYEGAPEDGTSWEIDACGARVVRGGSWGDRAGNLRSAVRHWLNPDGRGTSSWVSVSPDLFNPFFFTLFPFSCRAKRGSFFAEIYSFPGNIALHAQNRQLPRCRATLPRSTGLADPAAGPIPAQSPLHPRRASGDRTAGGTGIPGGCGLFPR